MRARRLPLLLLAAVLAAPSAGEDSPERIVFPSCAGEVIFPHGMHSEDLGMECASCHHETRAADLKMPHGDYFDDFWIDCRTCHRPGTEAADGGEGGDPRSCSGCHRLLPANIADETLSPKVAIHKSCWQCHEVGTGADASASCVTCHAGGRDSH